MALLVPFFLDCVVALGAKDAAGNTAWRGTGFFYGRKVTGSSDRYFVYLVTNKHVVDGHQELQLRVNPAAMGAAREYRLDLAMAIHHPNPQVDVAAVPVNINLLEAEGMRVGFFADAQHCAPVARLQSEGVAEGDSVFLLGYPMGLIGGVGAAALVRSGTIARLRDVFAAPQSPFLIDGSVYPGNSGGPVVSKPELVSVSGTTAVSSSYLIGIVASYTPYQDVAVSQQTGRPRVIFEENSGIAQVFTVDMIAETVEIHASGQPQGQDGGASQVDVEEMEQAGQDRSEGSPEA